jgi:hypothetical protein
LAPSYDVTTQSSQDIKDIISSTNIKTYNLASISGDANGTPLWGGKYPILSSYFVETITLIRASGGDVIVTFNNDNSGFDISQNTVDAFLLANRYQTVIDGLKLTFINVELYPSLDIGQLFLHIQALSLLKSNNPFLTLSISLETASPNGLDSTNYGILKGLVSEGVAFDILNVRAYDYASDNVPNSKSGMGTYVVATAQGVQNQLKALNANAKVGLTVILGQDDIQEQNFYPQDAEQVITWAKTESGLTFLSFKSSPSTLSPSYTNHFRNWAGISNNGTSRALIPTTQQLIRLVQLAVSTTGKCGNGFGICPGTECCSQYGWCGSGLDWCGTGCQPDFGKCPSGIPPVVVAPPPPAPTTPALPTATKSQRCGRNIAKCASGLCCSVNGWCDNAGAAWCGAGCQTSFG